MMSASGISALLLIYALLMAGSTALTIWFFRGKFEESGRFFMAAEIIRIIPMCCVAIFHLASGYWVNLLFVAANAFYILSELMFIFSVRSISNKINIRIFIISGLGLLLSAAAVEVSRFYWSDQRVAIFIYAILHAAMHAVIISICISQKNKTLSRSPFWGILTIIEVIFFIISFVRLFALVGGVKLTPLSAGLENVILFAVWVALLFFRYVAYQGVLMTWVSPEARENRLNQHLLASLRERDKLLQKLTASNRQLGASALAGAVAHQLSQPLTGAALQAAALKRDTLARGEVDTARRVERISNQIEELSDLLRDMRSLFGAREEQYSRVEMASICDEVLNLVESSHVASGITFKRSMSSRSCIMGNSVQIQQVIINIIENAVQSLSSDRNGSGLIEFMMSDGEGSIEITIYDNGKGFDCEYIDNVFDIYYTTKDDGMGVGLWLCRQIVEKHGGSISVSNRSCGGASVSLKFPVSDVSL